MTARSTSIAPCRPGRVDDVAALLERVWSAPPGAGPVTPPILHTLLHVGACILVAEGADGELLAALVAFRSTTERDTLHVHVMGVAEQARGAGLGRQLLQGACGWATRESFARLAWTFDPLVSRNAHLYLRVFGASVDRYVRDPYGEMRDGLNAEQGSDRVVATLDLRGRAAAPAPSAGLAPDAISVGASGAPECHAVTGALCAVKIPRDIDALRATRPDLGRAWRSATREVLGRPGASIVGFAPSGRYIVRAGS